MDNLPRQSQDKTPRSKNSASRVFDDLLDLLVDLDINNSQPKSISNSVGSTTSQNLDQETSAEKNNSRSEPYSNSGHQSSPPVSKLIAAHRQSLLKSLAIAPTPNSNEQEQVVITTNPQPPISPLPLVTPSTPVIKFLASPETTPVIINSQPELKIESNSSQIIKESENFPIDNLDLESLLTNPQSPILTPELHHSENNYSDLNQVEIIYSETSNLEVNNSEVSQAIAKETIYPEVVQSPNNYPESNTIALETYPPESPYPSTNNAVKAAASFGLLMNFVLSSQDIILKPIESEVPLKDTLEILPEPSSTSIKVPKTNSLTTPVTPEIPKFVTVPEVEVLVDRNIAEETLQEDNKLATNSLQIESIMEEDPLDILQRLLVSPDVYDAQKLLDSLGRKLSKIEAQIYDPEKLIELLLPSIAELLSLKVIQSRDEVVEAITPIIDEVIQHRIEQDRMAMSSAIAPIISEAISKQIMDSPEEIANAIGPTMGKAIQEQIRLEKDTMVDALYPIIGSTISKYMAEAVADINRQVETAFSVEGLKRKVQAKVQGVSEADLILREAMPFTVHAAFLIHKSSGLLIADAQPPEQEQLESDMIAGMLTAIRSFANDCMTNSNSSIELNQIDYSDSKIVLEVAGYCYLALVIRGEMTSYFVKKVRRSMATIVQIYSRPIMSFEGDRSTIPIEINTLIEELVTHPGVATKTTSRYPVTLGLVILAVLGAVAIPWGIYQYHQNVNRQLVQQVTTALDHTPELSVYRLGAEVIDGQVQLLGKVPNTALRERAAIVAQQAIPTKVIDNQIISIDIPVDSSFTALEVQRTTGIINQIPGILITSKYNQGQIEVSGVVKDKESLDNVTKILQKVPGVKIIANQIQLGNINQNVVSSKIYFDQGSIVFSTANLPQIVELKNLLNLTPEVRLLIIGNTDTTGSILENQQIALARAASVQQALIDQGVKPQQLEIKGAASPVQASELWQGRFVEFQLIKPK